jgi:hypothetical protein
MILGPYLEDNQSGREEVLSEIEGKWDVEERPCSYDNPADVGLVVDPPQVCRMSHCEHLVKSIGA